jgi:hypothetical protein
MRALLRVYRRFIWLDKPLHKNHLLDEFFQDVGPVDHVISNGDHTCGSAWVGVSDDACFESVKICLEQLRKRFSPGFQATIGDHDLGKMSFVGRRGGMRLASWHRAVGDLQLKPFWQIELGHYSLIGITSSLIALPVFEHDTLPEELPAWRRLRLEHFAEVREAFSNLDADQRVLLFCHDPTALQFLWGDDVIRAKLPQIEQTIIGHFHTNLVLRTSRVLAGIPPITFLGHTARRMSTALSEARHWRPFKVRLCPSLAGVELLKDGGFYTVDLDEGARQPAKFEFHSLPR